MKKQNQELRREYLIEQLLKEDPWYNEIRIPLCEKEQKKLLRALMNVRPPKAAPEEFLKEQDLYLQEEIRCKGITDVSHLQPVLPGIYVWKGDITTLHCDAIVNAANSQMLGCFHPNHGCIDNAIHTFAGIQLRKACADLMAENPGYLPTGKAVLTPAFNLPAKAVIHTVGPIVYGSLTDQERDQLADCYRNSLVLADANGLKSIAFCCISTGEFRFPGPEAAKIAVASVERYKKQTGSEIEVIFNVFKDEDEAIYRKLLAEY